MRGLFWLLGLFALAVIVSVVANLNEGYVIFMLPPWRVELSLNFFAALAAGSLFVAYALVRATVHMVRLPGVVQEYRRTRRRERARKAFRDAIQQLFEGRFGQAIKNAARAYGAQEAPALSALLAARAARGMRDEEREQEWSARAAEYDNEIRNARLMAEAQNHLDAHRNAEAAAVLDTLQSNGQRHIAALRLALRAYRYEQRWSDVVRVVRLLEKHKALSEVSADQLKLRAHLETLRSHEGDGAAIRAYWQALPAKERESSRLALTASRALIAADDSSTAAKIIEHQLDEEWNTSLAELYGECRGGDLHARISKAERWLLKHPSDAKLLLALARMCCQLELWGKAQSYFEASLSVEPSREANADLARLLDRLGETDQANRYFRRAAELCGEAG